MYVQSQFQSWSQDKYEKMRNIKVLSHFLGSVKWVKLNWVGLSLFYLNWVGLRT